MSSTGSSDPVFAGRPLTVRRVATARRMRLAVDPRDGAVRLTLPGRTSLKTALAWAEGHRAWIERTLDALPQARPIADGTTLPVEGREVTICWDAGHGRAVRLDGDRLLVGGPADLVAPRVLRWLRTLAAERLEAATRHYAEVAGVTVGRVSLGDPRSRWGSCTASGDIRYSWRLVLAPPEIVRATAAHEVAHRLHMNHGPAFHRAVADLFGRDPDPERAWLKRHGVSLHRVGRVD